MITPATILRDTCLAGLALTIGGMIRDPAFGATVAAGALGAIVNLWLLMRLVGRMAEGGAGFAARLVFKQVAGLVILGGLVAKLPAGPVLIGFCSVLLALTVRAFVGLVRGAPAPTPLEPG